MRRCALSALILAALPLILAATPSHGEPATGPTVAFDQCLSVWLRASLTLL